MVRDDAGAAAQFDHPAGAALRQPVLGDRQDGPVQFVQFGGAVDVAGRLARRVDRGGQKNRSGTRMVSPGSTTDSSLTFISRRVPD